ncbi:alpha-glutamyl/putrescinyl thymine pyrophosphorylase clade 3 protein [Pseudomonas tohonis]|uniref:alpha-glutamyl/putrescinyl thymine pyrophosphorylase clade 3 protein n=1 Tax=Pseudomonas tohonis TaxID=2725477 RepID=UPI001F3F2459|nr:hypothetical protein [Pseudomonas tohonis]GJN48273.1 hypothetical protein TUM20249_42590 [Pseudomonas tohonis]
MRERDKEKARELEEKLENFSKNIRPLPGIEPQENRQVLIDQLIDSIRRIKYVETIRQRRLSPLRSDANSEIFDPIKAAVLHAQGGNIEEASWLIFLATHFGKSSQDGWALTQAFYNALGQGFVWSWERVAYNPEAVLEWLARNYPEFALRGYRFGNHRKYETMNPAKNGFTGLALRSYVNWILSNKSHAETFNQAIEKSQGNSKNAFRQLYKSMSSVSRFGRMGKFDYLTMIAKVGVANIEADSTYMGNATGPYDGGNLLFSGKANASIPRKTLDNWLIELDEELGVGMQVLEDALCNWQKSPGKYIRFRG